MSYDKCSCWNCVVLRRAQENAKRDLIDFAKSGGPIVDGLRAREAAFNEDVLPPGTTVLAPRELYGDDMWPPRAVPRMREQTPWSAVEAAKDETHPKRGWRPYAAPVERPVSLTAFAREFHAGAKIDRNTGEMLMLVVSEIAECMEGERRDLMDDHLPHRKMAEVELADAIIRIADIVGSRGEDIDLDAELSIIERSENTHIAANKGEALLHVIRPLQEIRYYEGTSFRRKLARTWHRIERYAKKHGYDLWGAVAEKREYNRHRADHKPAARLAANGKKF